MSEPVSFPEFYWLWAQEQRWTVPDLHWAMCDWLGGEWDLGVLLVFRGAAKSTILAVYNAWRYYRDRTYRILHQGDQDGTAYKTSRDTRAVLRRHPLTREWGHNIRGETQFWWVPGARDERNPSMQAAGVMTNIVSSRADEVQNDDVEVQKNIQTPEARAKLRYRLSEQTHILVPGGRTLYVGTPHSHDSLYAEQEQLGANVLRIPLFRDEHRIELAALASYRVPFEPEYVFAGIGKFAKLLEPGADYQYSGGRLRFAKAPEMLIDCYRGCAWPGRFDRKEIAKRRRRCRTINEWDSQYQLHAKPLEQVRLDPERLRAYDLEPTVRMVNGEVSMWLGSVQIVSAVAYWDCSLGKLQSDASAFTLLLTDARGSLYWHRAIDLTGELAVFDEKTGKITSGQCAQIVELVTRFQIPRVDVETNGPGGFVPPILRRALKGTGCAVGEVFSTVDKRKRILDALEPPLSARFLWAHVNVIDGPVWDQMKDFNPAVREQPDDYLDSASGAITSTPVRIGKVVGKPDARALQDWRPSAGVHEVQFET
jgi:hypothetical protein